MDVAFDIDVAADADDGVVSLSGGVVNNNSVDFILTDYDVFLRFASVGIPQGAVLVSAKIALTCPDGYAGAIGDLVVEAYDQDNATVPASYASHATRDRTTETVAWNTPASVGNLEVFEVDISDVVQEVVDRAGFTSSSAIVIILRAADGGTTSVAQYLTGTPARLYGEYEGDSPSGGIGSANFNRFLCPGAR